MEANLGFRFPIRCSILIRFPAHDRACSTGAFSDRLDFRRFGRAALLPVLQGRATIGKGLPRFRALARMTVMERFSETAMTAADDPSSISTISCVI
jgi:hypothetical protein